MTTIEVKIKFITPAFIGGVDKLQKNEFRTASFKGLLRYWWRALCSDNLSLEEMKKREEEIFGGQQNKSPFVLRIKVIKYANNNDRNILKDNTYIGIKYLFYPFYQNIVVNNQRKNFLENGKFINSGSELTIEFIFKKNDTNIIKEVLKALWALENFGGIGARSRRGAGSFKVIGITGIDENIKNSIPKFLYEEEKNKNFKLSEFLTENFKKLNEKIPDKLQKFTKVSKNECKFKIIKGDSSWDSILNDFGKKYQKFRKDNKNYSISFGLPYKNIKSRRASPLFIKVGEYNNKYYLLITCLWSEFLPEKNFEDLKSVFKDLKVNEPNKNHINEFLKNLG